MNSDASAILEENTDFKNHLKGLNTVKHEKLEELMEKQNKQEIKKLSKSQERSVSPVI